MNDKKGPRPRRSSFRRFLLGLSGFSAAGLIYAYNAQPDDLAGLTVVPAVAWLLPAVFSILFFSGRNHKLFSLTVFSLWALFAFTSVEEVQSLLRRDSFPTGTWQAAHNEGRAIRVVSLNCNSGQPQCAAEVASLDPKPDIILFQESPGEEDLKKLAAELYGEEGGVAWSTDVSVVARGKVESTHADPDSVFLHAKVQLPDGKQVEAISLRLMPPVIRYDFWSSGFWRENRAARRDRRRQVESVVGYLSTVPSAAPLLVGGDLNCAAEDGSMLPLRARLNDTFDPAGHGNCNTATNKYPLERVDQLWINAALQSEWLVARKTDYSDHRMVICDLSIR